MSFLTDWEGGAERGEWALRPLPLTQTCYTYPTMMKLGTGIPYLKKIKKILSSTNISIFSPGISKFCYIRTYKQKLGFKYIFSNSFDFCPVFKGCFNQHVYNFEKAFWNKAYGIIFLSTTSSTKKSWVLPTSASFHQKLVTQILQ